MGGREWRDPQWAPPSARSSQGRDTLGPARLKEGELKSGSEGGVEERVPAITWDRSDHSWLISFIPRLPPFPSTPPFLSPLPQITHQRAAPAWVQLLPRCCNPVWVVAKQSAKTWPMCEIRHVRYVFWRRKEMYFLQPLCLATCLHGCSVNFITLCKKKNYEKQEHPYQLLLQVGFNCTLWQSKC